MTRRRFHFSTVVWGPWHTSVYLNVNLPSLLTPGNLPAFAERHDVTYRLLTAPEDIPRIKSSPAYQRAREIVHFQLVSTKIDPTIDPIGMHHLLWRQCIDDARRAKAMILFVPPDVVWSNTSLGHVGKLADEGSDCIFMTYLRVVEETAVPEVSRRFTDDITGIISASSTELVSLALRHIHPLALSYVRESEHFPIHPELILWPVKGEGFLMRVLVREMFAYDPREYDLTPQALLAHAPSSEKVHYITDSDDLFALSLAPLAKDSEWYMQPRQLSPLEVGAWWLRNDSPGNDVVAGLNFYIHDTPRSPRLWRTAELRGDALMLRLAGTRDVLRITTQFAEAGIHQAEQALNLALAECRLDWLGRLHPNVTFLVPQPRAVQNRLINDPARRSNRGARTRLLRLILDHMLIGNVSLFEGRASTLTTASGATRQLTWQGDTALVDGVPIDRNATPVGRYTCHLTSEVLPVPPNPTQPRTRGRGQFEE